ncbi:WhiB family transcriptional regulator [Streptomyces sp. CA-142005]
MALRRAREERARNVCMSCPVRDSCSGLWARS